MSLTKQDLKQVREELKPDFNQIRTELKQDMVELRKGIISDLTESMMQHFVSKYEFKGEISRIDGRLEDINDRLVVVQDTLLKMSHDMDTRLIFLEGNVRQLNLQVLNS